MRLVRSSDLVTVFVLALVAGGTAAVLASRVDASLWWGVPMGLLVGLLGLRRPLRRWRAARAVLPETSRAWLREHVRVYRSLNASARRRFETDVGIVLAEWRFEGTPGAEVTGELRLAVAAGAALLLHGRPTWELPRNRTVLFYPATFDDDYETGDYGVYDGMVHAQGPVVLSVPAVQAGWARDDGFNVVLHELAHLLDVEATGADGIPSLLAAESSEAWQKLVREEMGRIRTGRSVLRRYAATNPAELFAVTTEQFFERPSRLQRHHPELFDAFVALFALDPRTDDEEASETASEPRSLIARRWESAQDVADDGT